MKQLLCALAALVAFAGSAAAEQVVVTGFGEAQADVQRVAVSIVVLNPNVDAAAAQTSFDSIKSAVHQADPSATEMTDRQFDEVSPPNGVSAVAMHDLPHLRIEIAVGAAQRVTQALGGAQRSVTTTITYIPVATNRAQLHDQAVHAALANAQQNAQRLAAAASWRLGSLKAITEIGSGGDVVQGLSLAGLSVPTPPRAIMHATLTATFDAAPN